MKTEGSITLVIRGTQFDIKEFSKKMSIKSTRVLEKGQKSGRHKMAFSLWEYETTFNQDDINEVLDVFLTMIKSNIQIIESVKKNNECLLDMFLHSNAAQLGITVSPRNLLKMAELDLRLDVSILSYGLVYGEDGTEHNINELIEYE
jgi:hypothetical protein